jgi:hypothetical protein
MPRLSIEIYETNRNILHAVAILAGITAIMTELFCGFHYFLQPYANSVPQLSHNNFFFKILSNSHSLLVLLSNTIQSVSEISMHWRVSTGAQNCLYKQGSRNALLMLQQQGRQEPDQNPSGTSNKSGVC